MMDMPTNCPYCGDVVEFDSMVELNEGSLHKFSCQECFDRSEDEAHDE